MALFKRFKAMGVLYKLPYVYFVKKAIKKVLPPRDMICPSFIFGVLVQIPTPSLSCPTVLPVF